MTTGKQAVAAADPTRSVQDIARPFSLHPRAELCLSIGYTIEKRFVTLPQNVPIETIEPAELDESDPDWPRHELLKVLQNLGTALRPGEEFEISSLVVKLRRHADLPVAERGTDKSELDPMLLNASHCVPTEEPDDS